jgi:hypothetical protein
MSSIYGLVKTALQFQSFVFCVLFPIPGLLFGIPLSDLLNDRETQSVYIFFPLSFFHFEHACWCVLVTYGVYKFIPLLRHVAFYFYYVDIFKNMFIMMMCSLAYDVIMGNNAHHLVFDICGFLLFNYLNGLLAQHFGVVNEMVPQGPLMVPPPPFIQPNFDLDLIITQR